MVPKPFNIYCDESTHLRNDGMPFLVLGGLSCPLDETRNVSEQILELKKRYGISRDFEIKWQKVSPSKLDFYADLVDLFFDSEVLSFRAVVAPKAGLLHDEFRQTHDDWYYKMMFYLVRNMLQPDAAVYIYLDKKDTRSGVKAEKLHNVIANSQYDFDRQIIRRVQMVESHHVNQMQLADLLTGATNYVNRGLSTSSAKVSLVDQIRRRSNAWLTRSTLPSEEKFNVFHWRARQI